MTRSASRLASAIGERIRSIRLRQADDTTLASLAERAGMSEATLSRIERGLIPLRLAQVEAIAEALNVVPEALLCQDQPRRVRSEAPTVRIRPVLPPPGKRGKR